MESRNRATLQQIEEAAAIGTFQIDRPPRGSLQMHGQLGEFKALGWSKARLGAQPAWHGPLVCPARCWHGHDLLTGQPDFDDRQTALAHYPGMQS